MKITNVWGVGPLWGTLVVAYAVTVGIVSRGNDIWRISGSLRVPAISIAVIFLLIGLPLYVLAAKAIFRGFSEGKLVTTGVYAICRHPLYGAWVVFIIPAIELILGSWLGLTTVAFAYLLLRYLARSEEKFLEDKFGDDYRSYRARTPFVLPYGLIRNLRG